MIGFWMLVLFVVVVLSWWAYSESNWIENSAEPAPPTKDAYDV